MAKKANEKVVTRTVILGETDWKWLLGWMEKLLQMIQLDEMSTDSLRMGSIYKTMERAERTEEKPEPKKKP